MIESSFSTNYLALRKWFEMFSLKTIFKLKFILSLNFWDEAWCLIFCVWFYGLLSSYFVNLMFNQQSNLLKNIFQGCEHFYVQWNKGHLRKAGGYSGRNVVFQLTKIKMRTTVRKITHKIWYIKSICSRRLLKFAAKKLPLYYSQFEELR